MDRETLADWRIGELLDEVGADRLTPGAGAVAALTGAVAAAVAESVARLSREQATDADAAIEKASELRERLALLADANAAAYQEATRSLGREGPDDPIRDARLSSDLALAAYTPPVDR